MDKRFQSSGC